MYHKEETDEFGYLGDVEFSGFSEMDEFDEAKIDQYYVKTFVKNDKKNLITKFIKLSSVIDEKVPKYANVKEYFDFVDSHGYKRVMLIGGCKESNTILYIKKDNKFMMNTTKKNINKKYKYELAGGWEKYFFVNLNEDDIMGDAKPDFICDVKDKKMLTLGINEWDSIVFEGVTFFQESTEIIYQLLKKNGTITCRTNTPEKYDKTRYSSCHLLSRNFQYVSYDKILYPMAINLIHNDMTVITKI